MKRIDVDTAAKIKDILMLCRSRGEDPVTVLDSAGFLRYQASRERDALRLLEDGILPGVRALRIPTDVKTPLDTKNLILQVLEDLRDQYQAAQ